MDAINTHDNSRDDDDNVKRNTDSIEYEQVEIWSERQCNICGVAQKRSRSKRRSRGEDDEQETDHVKHLATTKRGTQTRARAEASGLVGLRATLPPRVPALGQRRTTGSHHCGADIVAIRVFSGTDKSTMELLADKGNGKIKGKGKGVRGEGPAVWN